MKKILALSLTVLTTVLSAQPVQSTPYVHPDLSPAPVMSSQRGINWQTDYENARQEAKSKNLPLVLFFTGSDWCTWCHKLENEALNTSQFSDAVKDKFVFVKLDFPRSGTPAQNKNLQKQYDVKGFPSIIILDSQGRHLGNAGYRPGGGAQYAQHLLNIANGQKS